jgi:hypothetical protein
MRDFILVDITFQRGRSGRLLNVFSLLGGNGRFEVILTDENLPLTNVKLAEYVIDEFEDGGDDSKDCDPILDVMEVYGAEMTRNEYIETNWLGETDPGELPPEIEDDMPLRFKRARSSRARRIRYQPYRDKPANYK